MPEGSNGGENAHHTHAHRERERERLVRQHAPGGAGPRRVRTQRSGRCKRLGPVSGSVSRPASTTQLMTQRGRSAQRRTARDKWTELLVDTTRDPPPALARRNPELFQRPVSFDLPATRPAWPTIESRLPCPPIAGGVLGCLELLPRHQSGRIEFCNLAATEDRIDIPQNEVSLAPLFAVCRANTPTNMSIVVCSSGVSRVSFTSCKLLR